MKSNKNLGIHFNASNTFSGAQNEQKSHRSILKLQTETHRTVWLHVNFLILLVHDLEVGQSS